MKKRGSRPAPFSIREEEGEIVSMDPEELKYWEDIFQKMRASRKTKKERKIEKKKVRKNKKDKGFKPK